MEELIFGNTLLVGEGDFSFTVSMVEKLPSKKHHSIIATSLETEESIKKHQYAARNISQLKEKGVTVRLNTDATQLHISPLTRNEMFSCIIFNFPHAGGKSNHKKNRKLLNDFFASAVQVLENQGQIMMTLCKGQGGTPADQPRRAWHDSWQVVSMAANSSLILTNILPFRADEYRVYTSTGFRSLDKGFNTENALTHVFEMADPVSIPVNVDTVKIKLGKHMFLCPAYIYRKLLQIRYINCNKDHPIHRVYEKITQCLTSVTHLKVENLGIRLPMNRSTVSASCNEIRSTSDKGSYYKLVKSENTGFEEIDDISDLTGENVLADITDDDNDIIFELDQFNFISADKLENMQVVYGPVCRPCDISLNQSPVSCYITMAWPVAIDEDNSEGSEYLQRALTKAVAETTSTFKHILNNVIVKSECKVDMINYQFEDFKNTRDSQRTLHVANINLHNSTLPSASSGVLDNVQNASDNIGECHVKIIGDHVHPSHMLVYLTANLCKLACSRYNIEDERLLWSSDTRVLHQFPRLNLEDKLVGVNHDKSLAESDQILLPVDDSKPNGMESPVSTGGAVICHPDQVQKYVIKSPSMYPMTFVHDMSFWENQRVQFNVQEYCDIIRDIADDNVILVDLIDTYTDPESGNRSRCYRLTFQSVDKALSYNISWKLQSLIRFEVEKKMKIVLR
ncbi:ferredoxin-fold anticodon-binding domain-containing protein 1 homolog [Mercenaria mercenaria]|uniref:ferredoxin-fold anticodon-binding domain-containing protein 1 homolog n=1 Tax=Mercenaria mercenaria TaxID=6596 RepID=UPI00234E7EDB|nr:ferredoxin-fold anticodon-binding domain-containing protein 1 homolog [Mercenaria mercenaria]XP_053397877.1 ferredoxin-fold anticodon-binding domain-containing protein 1 homolog [Mercenaria mercenaria]